MGAVSGNLIEETPSFPLNVEEDKSGSKFCFIVKRLYRLKYSGRVQSTNLPPPNKVKFVCL